MIANTLELLSSPRAKKDKKTSKSPLSIQATVTPSSKKLKLPAFAQLLNETKESKKQKTSTKSSLPLSKISVRKQDDNPSALLPTFAPIDVAKQEQTPILKPQKNVKKSTRVKVATPTKTTLTQSTQEQLLLQKQTKASTNAKKHTQLPLNEVLTQVRASKTQQKGTKTLADVAKIAQSHQLNLTKLELKSQEAQSKPIQTAITQSKKESKHSSLKHLLNQSREKPQRISQNAKKDIKEISKNIQSHIKTPSQSIKEPQNLNQPQVQETLPEKAKDFSLAQLLKTSSKEKSPSFESKEENKLEEKSKESKTQDFTLGELKRDMQFKITSSRETLTQFSQRIREEILNYKPPFSKLSMELNPSELGKLEITITKKGKELVINVNANNSHALQAFMQNQNEFRNTLSNVGFSNVELNFSQGEGKEGGQNQEGQKQKRNKNSLEETITEIPALASMEIKMVQYA